MHYIFLTFSLTTWTLLIVLAFVICLLLLTENKHQSRGGDEIEPDGPVPFPVIGSLHLLFGYRVPYDAFRNLANIYGNVFKIKLGSVQCVVVNGLDNIREVLMAKGDHFDGRPDFQRFNLMFNGDKRNSLAFCDWSELQRMRRELLRAHTFPQSFSAKFHQLDAYINSETRSLLQRIGATHPNQPINFKPLLSAACANIFLLHFCGKRFQYEDASFAKMIFNFDRIFYEVNQGYAVDFMPWMLPFYRRHFNEFRKWTKPIREFTMRIVNERYSMWEPGRENCDYIDTLIETIRRDNDQEIDLEIAMFSLEDIIGGHSAVTNFLMKVLAYITTRPYVQTKIKEEIQSVTKGTRDVNLLDRRSMPYTEAVILETIRLIASPIVPHVASQDSSISGYKVRKGTTIFLNNFDLNRSPQLWDNPEEFSPERFLNDGVLVKPDHFFPFSSGRRSCMGYKLVQLLSFSIIALTLQTYRIQPVEECSYQVPIGDLALPFDAYKFKFVS